MSARLVSLSLLCGLVGASPALGQETAEPRPAAPSAVLLSLQACCASEHWGEAAPGAAADAAPAAAAEAEPVPSPKPFGLRLGFSGQGSPGGAGGRAALELCFGYSVIPALALEAEALVTIAGGAISTSEVYATMNVVALRGWVIWEARNEGILRPSLGLGGGALITRVKAPASSSGSGGGGDFLATGYLGVLARLALALSHSLWLRVGLRVGLSLPEVEVHIGGSRAGRLGLPLVEGYGAVEFRF